MIAASDSWDMPFVERTVHRALDVKLRMAYEGREHVVVLGDPGTGKSFPVSRIIDRLQEENVEALVHAHTLVVAYDAMASSAAKATLVSLYSQVSGTDELREGLRRMWTPDQYRTQIVRQLIANATRLICVDEAQNLQPHEIEQLRQVVDKAEQDGHPVGLVLVGTPALRHKLEVTGQVGQRFSAFIEMPLLTADDVNELLPSLHPGLAKLHDKMSPKQWSSLATRIWRASGGKWRRIFRIISNANEYARRRREPFGESHVDTAIAGLEPEV